MTSVKDIHVEIPPDAASLGRGSFRFTDAYSVFDWGKMPDTIPYKGQSLCTMGAFNFERLETAGVSTHYRGVIPEDGGEAIELDRCTKAPREMAIDLARVPNLPRTDDGYDYDAFHRDAGDAYVVPLEVIFRNRVPIGSSLRRRREPSAVGLDVEEWPAQPIELTDPIVEFSTKFEHSDRYLDTAEAATIAGAADLAVIEELAREVNAVITEQAQAAGFRHDDGKIEVLYHDGDLLVADVAGTFDENRFTYDGQQVSKEVLRQFYKRYDPYWLDDIEAAKIEAKRSGRADWKALCSTTPEPLPEGVVRVAGELYAAGADTYTGLGMFDVGPLPEVLDRLEGVLARS